MGGRRLRLYLFQIGRQFKKEEEEEEGEEEEEEEEEYKYV